MVKYVGYYNCISSQSAAMMIVATFMAFAIIFSSYLWMPPSPDKIFGIKRLSSSTAMEQIDNLETALQKASMRNKTVIISILNEAYAEENGLLDLFLKSLHEGENTKFLIKHLLLVAVDKIAFERCRLLGLHCYMLVTEDIDLSEEVIYMSENFIKMMWRRTKFLGDVIRLGYSFIFTDMDVLWLRNPFPKLRHKRDDMQISCDLYNHNPYNVSNPLNTGFYFVVSNNKTIALYEEWYENRKNAVGLKEQDVLTNMAHNGTFERLGMKVRFLDTVYFSGFCQDSRNIRKVRTVHANCCRIVKSKLADLSATLEFWKRFNSSSHAKWPEHKACQEGWLKDVSKYELNKSLEKASMRNKTLIISMLNKAHLTENGMLDLFLQSLNQGVNTKSLINHVLFVALDHTALDRCKRLKLHCFRLVTEGVNFSKKWAFTDEEFNKMMWQKVHFLGDALKLGYSFIYTDLDVMWLQNPFSKLTHNVEDMQISCDVCNGNPFDEVNPINTGFYYVVSNNKTVRLFDTWYAFRKNTDGMNAQDTLSKMKTDGTFRQMSMKVKLLDTRYFSGFCQPIRDLREAITVHANCCSNDNAKLEDLRFVLQAWKIKDTESVRRLDHRACHLPIR